MRPLLTRAEKDALNLGLEGLTGRTKKVPGYGVKVQTSCSQLTEMGHANYSTTSSVSKPTTLHCLCQLTDKNTVILPGYFNISAGTDTNTPAHLTPRYQTKHVSALYALHCETFWFSASKKSKIKQSCKETEDYI